MTAYWKDPSTGLMSTRCPHCGGPLKWVEGIWTGKWAHCAKWRSATAGRRSSPRPSPAPRSPASAITGGGWTYYTVLRDPVSVGDTGRAIIYLTWDHALQALDSQGATGGYVCQVCSFKAHSGPATWKF